MYSTAAKRFIQVQQQFPESPESTTPEVVARTQYELQALSFSPELRKYTPPENYQGDDALQRSMDEKREKNFIQCLTSTRRLVETVIGQLTDRFQIEEVRASKLWYLTNRIARKVLAHTVCVYINKKIGNPPLQFGLLLKP